MRTSPNRRTDPALQPSAEEQAVNERLPDIIKANTVRVDNVHLPKRGFVSQAYAVFSLLGLMIVAFVYSKFFDAEA